MKKIRYQIIDVFASGVSTMAVFIDGQGLESSQMQQLASRTCLSVNAFILPPADESNDYAIRIFTPVIEIPMTGEHLLGSVFALAIEGMIVFSNSFTEILLESGSDNYSVKVGSTNPDSFSISACLPNQSESNASINITGYCVVAGGGFLFFN